MDKDAIALNELRQLAHKMNAAGLQELEWRDAHRTVRLRYDAPDVTLSAAGQETVSGQTARALTPVCAPMPGHIVLCHPSHGEAYVQPGQRVKQHDLLALVKVGPLYLPLRSPVEATLAAIRVGELERVEYGSEIMLLDTGDAPGEAL